MFSGFYLALLLILACLIVRVLSFEWRGKGEHARWKAGWAWLNTLGSVGAPFLWGVALSSLLYGVPIAKDQTFAGSFGDLFHLYTVLAGIAVVLLFALHGAVFLSLRTLGDLRARSMRTAARLAPIAAVVGAGFLVWTLVVASDRNDKSVFPGILPVAVAAAAVVAAIVLTRSRRELPAFLATGLAIVAVVVTLFVSLYPRVLVSQPDFGNSLTVSNASSAALHAHGHDRRGRDPAPGRPPVPGLDVPRLPGADRRRGRRHAGRPRRADAGRPLAVRALDPRLLGRARAVRRLLVADPRSGSWPRCSCSRRRC